MANNTNSSGSSVARGVVQGLRQGTSEVARDPAGSAFGSLGIRKIVDNIRNAKKSKGRQAKPSSGRS